jgi:hypothetical protein
MVYKHTNIDTTKFQDEGKDECEQMIWIKGNATHTIWLTFLQRFGIVDRNKQ